MAPVTMNTASVRKLPTKPASKSRKSIFCFSAMREPVVTKNDKNNRNNPTRRYSTGKATAIQRTQGEIYDPHTEGSSIRPRPGGNGRVDQGSAGALLFDQFRVVNQSFDCADFSDIPRLRLRHLFRFKLLLHSAPTNLIQNFWFRRSRGLALHHLLGV